MRRNRLLCGLLVATTVLTVSGCGLGSDTQPTSLPVPEDVFPSGTPGTKEIRPSVDATLHPVYFFKEDVLVQIQRPLPAPVFLDAPLNNLLEGPTQAEAESGYASAIPAGTAIVDVALLRNNTISIHLNQTFFEIEGEQRIRASAQLVLTASGLVSDTQGVVFFLEGKPVQLPDGEGLIEEVGEGRLPSPLTVADYSALAPAS
ncbi:MAG: GerMN domain-containing protein [Acidimicrobiales bacterium]|nr:GerMN domain-containing protein [Acidimicrobiales bacterium]MDP6902607.1 GerMN domain-containing protein [Acidimicrobiales bacterium]